MGAEAHEIPVVPDSGEGLEVGGFILCFAFGAPEGDRLAREGFHADQIARFAVQDGHARGVVGLDGHAEAADLDLALVDG